MIQPAAPPAQSLTDAHPGDAAVPGTARTDALPLPPDPVWLLEHWPHAAPLAALVSADANPHARWSVLAPPVGVLSLTRQRGVLRSDWRWLDERSAGASPPVALTRDGLADLFAALDHPPGVPSQPGAGADQWFNGGWIGRLGYELGTHLEPSAGVVPSDSLPAAHTLAELFWCPWAYLFDPSVQRWRCAGDARSAMDFFGRHIHAQARRSQRLGAERTDAASGRAVTGPAGALSAFDTLWSSEHYQAAVQRIVRGISHGDYYQVNLAHRLAAQFVGSPRALFARAARSMRPWYGAYLETPAPHAPRATIDAPMPIAGAVLSLSPELFARFEPATRQAITRPIKGTRPAGPNAESDLRRSEKDRAELTMIIDLMRNDLGRICEPGSVHAEPQPAYEHHASGVVHGVGTVRGTLGPDARLSDFIRAAFPPGSVTGAPKIAAMRTIAELEPQPRGAYCGAVGMVSTCGCWAWNVAIRTIELACEPGSTAACARAVAEYGVGAGIVADSDPAREWQETLDKARAVLDLSQKAQP